MIDGAGLARVIHVLAVVIWIGGVAAVTTIILPLAASAREEGEGRRLFESVERRFSWIARSMLVLVGASGLYMLWTLDLWQRLSDPAFWWMAAMVAVWAVFAVLLFLAEPLLKRRMAHNLTQDPRRTFRRMQVLHWLLLAASLVTIAGAVAGAHGYRLF